MRVLAMLLAILSIAMVFPSTSEAATVPSIDLEASCKNMKVISGSTVYLDFLIERNYQDEYYYVNIYKGNSTAYENFIGYGDGWVEDYGDTVLLELWFNSADWGLSAGTVCTVEYYLEYWNGSKWVMTKPNTSTFQVIKNSCGSKHSYGSPSFVIDAPTCTENGYGAYKCTKCGIRKKTDIPKLGHKYGGWVVTKAATCANAGVRTSACQNCGITKTESIAKLSHKYDAGKVTRAATCANEGVKTFTCGGCGASYTQAISKIPHKYDNGKITQQPTCTKEGVKTYTCTGGCGSKKTSAVAKIPHKYDEGVVRTYPTCTLDGLKIYTCLGCKGTKSEVIPKGHTWNEGNIIVAPTVAKEGLKDCVCVDCGTSGKVEIPAIFSDVHTDWYTEYVQYVYDEGIMSGISGTTKFQPNENITKAQVAQVLYNMEGKPNPGGDYIFNDLKDVYSVEWYADAVSWAYNTGIITGDINTMKFNPNAAVTREQLAIMLYRYASSKRYDVSAETDFAGLIHAENISNWAYDGVNWAVGAGLISGIDKNGVKDLAPQGNASRAQVAAILQRFCENVVGAPDVEPEETPEAEVAMFTE